MANNIRKEGQGRSWSLTGEGMTYSKVIDPFKAVYEVKIRKGVYGTEGFACTVWVKKGETKVAHFVTLSDVARDFNKPTKIHRFSRKHSGQYWLTVDSTTVQTFGHFSFLPVGPNMSSRAASSSGKGDWEVICLAFQAPEEGVNTSSLEAYSFVGSEKRKLKLEFQGDTKTYKLQEASENDIQLSREVLGAPIIVENKQIRASNSGRWSVVGVLGLSEEGEFCPYFVSSEILGQLENTPNPSGKPEVDAPGGLHQVLPTSIQELNDQLNRSLLEDLMIEEHPKSQRRQEGSKVELKCKVRGGNAGNEVIYQWFKDITPMEGKTNSSLIFDPVRVRDFGVYKCEVRRSRTDQRYLTSYEAELDVTPRDGMSYSELSTVFNNHWEIRDKVAKKLSREIGGNKTWKQVALEYNVDQDDVHLIEKEKVPGDPVIDHITVTIWPMLTVYDFCKTLKKFRRLDIVEILLDHLCSQDV